MIILMSYRLGRNRFLLHTRSIFSFLPCSLSFFSHKETGIFRDRPRGKKTHHAAERVLLFCAMSEKSVQQADDS